MLTIMKLRDAEYVLRQIARGIEEYYTTSREPPGVWAGRWSQELGLEGVVEAEHLRALIKGTDPISRSALAAGNPPRKVNAYDATFSAPKSVSLLQALGTPEVAATVSICHTEALSVALGVLDRRTALTRRQVEGVRGVAGTGGLAVATFVHHTSRAADPQLHSHCVIPNLVRREDMRYVALDATHLYDWAKAAGSIYQEELRRRLTESLGVAWGEDRNGCREMLGLEEQQLRVFSKRSSDIEACLEANGSVLAETPAEKRALADAAALATRSPKDERLTAELLTARWAKEAEQCGLPTGQALVECVCGRGAERTAPSADVVFAHLLDPERGLCARQSRFGEAQVAAAIAAAGGGTLEVGRIEELTAEFLASEHVVRLVPRLEVAGRRPPQWSLASHRQREDAVLTAIETLATRLDRGVDRELVNAMLERLDIGEDQRQAVLDLCNEGPALRALISPAGHGKTTTLSVAASVMGSMQRPVIGLSTTHQAISELRRAGIDAFTVASVVRGRRCFDIPTGAVVILDEMSQCSTTDAALLLQRLRSVKGVQLWCAGDAAQAQSVAAGGLAHEIERIASEGEIPAPVLSVNRRQIDETEREALSLFRQGQVRQSQELRDRRCLEHELSGSEETQFAMASACADDIARLGPKNVVALCATHEEAEQLADAIRSRLRASDALRGPELTGPGWSRPRGYGAGDRVLVHSTVRAGSAVLHNGDIATIRGIAPGGISVRSDSGEELVLAYNFVRSRRNDGNPNLSHAWARTIDGAQGGTWDQVHLLGSPALDHQRAYVGQSRGRLPTHTWNARKAPETDHGGHLVQALSATESVAVAMERDHSQRFAATEDPYRKDRLLREERAKHVMALATLSQDRSEEREACRRKIDDLDSELEEHWARSVVAATREGDPLAFGRDKLAEARRTVERELDRRERIDQSPEHAQAGNAVAPSEMRDTQWSEQDLAELHFTSSFAAGRSMTERVLARSREYRATEDKRRDRKRSVERNRGRSFGR